MYLEFLMAAQVGLRFLPATAQASSRPARRKFRHVASVRRWGAGGIFSALRTRRIVDVPTRWPTLSSSPWILSYPQPLFSVASLTGRRSSHLRTDQDLPARHSNAGPSQPRSAEHLPRWRRFSAFTGIATVR
jgi:hypothetical protein